MAKFLRNKGDAWLYAAALIISVLLVMYAVGAARFVIRTWETVRDQNLLKNEPIVTFNRAKVEELRRR